MKPVATVISWKEGWVPIAVTKEDIYPLTQRIFLEKKIAIACARQFARQQRCIEVVGNGGKFVSVVREENGWYTPVVITFFSGADTDALNIEMKKMYYSYCNSDTAADIAKRVSSLLMIPCETKFLCEEGSHFRSPMRMHDLFVFAKKQHINEQAFRDVQKPA